MAERWTIGQLARRFGVARSTLLYYDKLRLLRPSGRSRASYRVYDDAAAPRLERICAYRRVGVPLADIAKLLDAKGTAAELLVARLDALDAEIARCREQQRIIVKLLGGAARVRPRGLDKERWVAILRASGLDDDAMHAWHVEFERAAPEAHEDFLAALGIAPAEIARIRRGSR